MVAEGGIKCWLGSAIPPAVVEEPFERFSGHASIQGTQGHSEIVEARSLSYTLDLVTFSDDPFTACV